MPTDPTYHYPKNPVRGNPGVPEYPDWNPNPGDTTQYGEYASIDDFADSFAVYVMQAGGITPPRDVSPDRKVLIELAIDQAK
jgi:hypothetical protein